MKLRRTVATYEACTPEAVSGGSQAQMMNFVRDAQHDIGALADALHECRKALAMMIAPDAIQNTTVLNAFAAAAAAEAGARALIGGA